jgi:sulfur-oxidizing protein SoxY
MPQPRRTFLCQGLRVASLLAGTALFPELARAFNKAAFDARTLADVVRACGGALPAESRDVSVSAPELAENGSTVPLALASTLPGVRQMLLLVEKNPTPLVARFDVNDALEPSFAVRAKMGQSSDVVAVAITRDGKAFYARREVKVTAGGCIA